MADRAFEEAALDRIPDLEIVGFHDCGCIGLRRRRLNARLGREQRFGVGMLRISEDFLHRALLDDLALFHHAYAVGDLPDDAEIVRDEKHRHAEAALQFFQELQDLRLHGDIERGGRLVGDEQFRFVRKRKRDHDALALSARKLVRVGAETLRGIGNADFREQLDHALARGFAAHAAMNFEHFHDLLTDGVQRIERRHRLLKHHRDVVAAHAAHFRFGKVQEVPALKQDFPARVMCGGGQEAEHGKTRDRFSRSGFADDGDGLALLHVERDAIYGERFAAGLAERNREIPDLEKRAHEKVFRGSKASRIASPMKIRRVRRMATVKKPVMPSQGACRLLRPWLSNSPSEGEPGGRP